MTLARHLTAEQRACMRAGLDQVLTAQETLRARETGVANVSRGPSSGTGPLDRLPRTER
ncbi:MAG TPA: hypothetical protein VF486_08930 [Actinomycetes bacterium]